MAINISSPASAAGSAASNTTVSNLASVPLTISGTTIAITSIGSMPNISVESATISNLASVPLTVSGTTIAITSLPPLGAAIVSLSAGTSVTISNLASTPLTFSGTTIAITSLPALGFGGSVSVTGLSSASVSVSNLSTTLQLFSGTTVAITSLPPLVAGSVTISALASVNFTVSGTTLSIPQINPSYFSFTSTYTSAATNSILRAIPGSLTSIYVTDCIFSNNATHGNMSLLQSKSNGATTPVLERIYFVDNGGAVINLKTPIVLDTNSALCFTSRSSTSHSVSVTGYIK